VSLALLTTTSAPVAASASSILPLLEATPFARWRVPAVVEPGIRCGGGGGCRAGCWLGTAGRLDLRRGGRGGRWRRRGGWRCGRCGHLAGTRRALDRCVDLLARSVAIRVRLALLGGGTGGTGSATSTGGTPAFVHAGAVGQG